MLCSIGVRLLGSDNSLHNTFTINTRMNWVQEPYQWDPAWVLISLWLTGYGYLSPPLIIVPIYAFDV